ncbi:MAG: FAD-binding protein, partial [Bacteroidetes bacterium]|nr:FAD-binding protein [Bacteroidota bacterium]
PNITVLENHFVVDLITQHHLGKEIRKGDPDIECYGVYALDLKTSVIETILARTTLLATGGIGNLYHTTTNPLIATGDGIALVYRAKGIIENMEFIQFHPTALYTPGERPSFLITEALRGFGAILRLKNGQKFMHKYDARESLAPRDIVAQSIDKEMKISGDDFVYLDCRHIDASSLRNGFPNIFRKCRKQGIDITKDLIPVTPAAHYLCGGIEVDEYGRSSIRNLYAAGEVASTGMHGANRLASNSLLEAVVFADRAANHAVSIYNQTSYKENVPEWNDEGTTHPEEMILITQNQREVQQIMTNYVGIVRSGLRLQRALVRLEIIYRETEELYKKSTLSQRLCELRNLINVGYLIIKMAQRRGQSIGLHYMADTHVRTTSAG